MSYKPKDQDQDLDRFEKIVSLKQRMFANKPREVIAEDLETDEQFNTLFRLSEQIQDIISTRESKVGGNDRVRDSLISYQECLNYALHRRADEVVTKICASYLRGDERLIVENPHFCENAAQEIRCDNRYCATRWIKQHQRIVDQLDLTYPEENLSNSLC